MGHLHQALLEAYDVGAELVNTVFDAVQSLWELGCVVVSVADKVVTFQLKLVNTAGKVLMGDIEGVKKDLQQLGIELEQGIDSINKLIEKAKTGLVMLERMTSDHTTRHLLVDYFDSLYESLTYRKSRTVELRVVAEIGLEVLLAIATVGVGTAIRLAANTAKAAKAASAVRIGPFPALAITQMVDLSQSLQKAAAMRAVPNIPPVKPLEIPDYGKAKPGGPMATPLKTEKPDTGDDSAGGAKTLPERKVIELEPGQKGSWNKTLNGKLEPNTNYKVGNKTYETDEHARVSRVSGELKPTKNDRNTYQQGKAGKESGIKDGYKDDEGGHIISSRHDGAGEQINYVPMNSNLNKGAWKQMENKWDNALQEGKKVEVDIKPIYDGASRRPEAFEVQYRINGSLYEAIFENIPGG